MKNNLFALQRSTSPDFPYAITHENVPVLEFTDALHGVKVLEALEVDAGIADALRTGDLPGLDAAAYAIACTERQFDYQLVNHFTHDDGTGLDGSTDDGAAGTDDSTGQTDYAQTMKDTHHMILMDALKAGQAVLDKAVTTMEAMTTEVKAK